MRLNTEEYYEVYEDLTSLKDNYEENYDFTIVPDEVKDKYNEEFFDSFNCSYDWNSDISPANFDAEDIEDIIDDMKKYKCNTYADLTIIYMNKYIDILKSMIKDYNLKRIYP